MTTSIKVLLASIIATSLGITVLCAVPKATHRTHTTPDTRSSVDVEHSKPSTPASSARKEWRTVHYLTLKFTQSSFTLSISQHIKDAANSFTLTMPTTKEFYDSVKEGTNWQASSRARHSFSLATSAAER